MHNILPHNPTHTHPEEHAPHEASTPDIPRTIYLSTVATSAATELPDHAAAFAEQNASDPREAIKAYYNRNLVDCSGHPPTGTDKLEKYQDIFADTAVKLFGDDILEKGMVEGYEFNPPLNELTYMLASLEHNAGVYYANEDVENIFEAMAQATFGNEAAKKDLNDPTTPIQRWTNEKIQEVTSLDHGTALPLVQDASGTWRAVDATQYGQNADFKPLEVLRQDNPDKRGWNKYRFRTSTYTRHQDDLHSKPVAEGWFTSEWYKEPNYWSAQVRNAIADVAKDVGPQLAESSTKLLFSTEGGTFKGTSTASTDLDTSCVIVCDSPVAFEHAYRTIHQGLVRRSQQLPFPIKEGDLSGMAYQFYDRSTGTRFTRTDDGEYMWPEPNQIIDGQIIEIAAYISLPSSVFGFLNSAA